MSGIPVQIGAGAAGEDESPGLAAGIGAALERLRRWEFWPAWTVYAPLAPYIAWLGVRHGGLAVCTACNPGIPMGGVVGESKSAILKMIPGGWALPHVLLEPGPSAARLERLAQHVHERGWGWPVVLKPDAGERGTGVRIVASEAEAMLWLREHAVAAIAQRYHPGPREAGVFYVRHPDEARGRIFSITDKVFAHVVGDGRSTVEELIRRHERFRLQARAHLAAAGTAAAQVPAAGQRVGLTPLGNHCRGTMFVDGRRLWTPALEAAVDQIGRGMGGFCFGRFDVRYADEAEFMAGRGFAVVEANGLLSESTDIYDPGNGFWSAQRTLRRQWRLAFEIGAAQRRRGVRPATVGMVARAVWAAGRARRG